VSLSAAWRAALADLDELIRSAAPFRGQCFRFVEIAYGLPDEVISGEGTRLHGGRFAPLNPNGLATGRKAGRTREARATRPLQNPQRIGHTAKGLEFQDGSSSQFQKLEKP
jgi:hypothetical protein